MSTAKDNLTGRLSIDELGNYKPEELGALALSAVDSWNSDPEWLTRKSNTVRLSDGYIDAPATLILVEKENYIDAFWFYFYPFNQGPYVMGKGPYGNHLGDWEHSLVRFNKLGVPQLVWMSAHGGGTAYDWGALETMENSHRPLIFAAKGTHANYVSVGQHSHDIPWHMLSDFTDRGDLWDPTMNYLAYTLNGSTVRPANGSINHRELEYGNWLTFEGCWGDFKLDKHDSRQAWSLWEWKMIDGPRGPLMKNLEREVPCERHKWWNLWGVCRVRHRVTPGEGIEAESTGCEALIQRLPFPGLWRPLVRGGYICFAIDRLWS